MNTVIYTRDNVEFKTFQALVYKAADTESTTRADLDGHKVYKIVYDLAIVALDGAEGMEVVREYTLRFPKTRVIWISNDPYFAGAALRNHIYDFITRPVDNSWLEHSIREAARLLRDDEAASQTST
ncbi:MAG: hypothetical protein K5655_01755, partial [Lachnospiraceae bacterium]|nr:hypothetical protein [Lachnospiraceae bacterium]